ncbi:MAG: TauD/TfdA family dioxygenase [Rhodospirillaceae bacterium]|jgi:taurine dioxygenase|nr:TauD/TfdA family dioxygenase [Rhodospirillaceae bacterium]MBT5663922.1 TauD/TfdA family dioxygenase [Rhodospirillaceae bacterium]
MASTKTITITPLSDHTGAEVEGVDLSKPIDAEVRARLNKAFVDHSVLVMRDQTLSAPQMLDAVKLFGEVFHQQNTRFALPECPEIHYISNQDKYDDGSRYIPGAGYHTDHSNAVEPPKATVLLALELPDSGGDTQYVNMQEAYDGLPEDTKRRIDGLKAVQVYQSRHSTRKLTGLSAENRARVADSVIHPIVRTHPENGRKGLFINPIRIDDIVGMEEAETLSLMDELMAHATQDKYQYWHKWRVGDLAMWDNRCLLHKANPDYDMDQMRYLYRVMLKGDAPY